MRNGRLAGETPAGQIDEQRGVALGRVPRLAHRRVILFFWPTRARILSLSRDVGEPDFCGVGSDALLAADLFQALGKTF
jgi:hypothetical protein